MKARENALIVLNKIEKDNLYANLELKNGLICEEKDKPLAVEIIYGVLRYKLNLDYVISLYSKIKPNKISLSVRNILRLSVYQLLYLDKIPESAVCNEAVKLTRKYSHRGAASFVNALLRKISLLDRCEIDYPKEQKEYLKIRYSFPDDIIDIFIKDYGFEKTEELLCSLNKNKGICVRPNLLKLSFGELKTLLDEKKVNYRVVDEKAFIINKSSKTIQEYFDKGLCTIQDRASMKTVELLNPLEGDSILDVCAAPGGKSCYMAELSGDNINVVSCDLHKHRVDLIRKTTERLGIKSINAIVSDGTVFNRSFKDKFNKILVDAPCSGLGVISKKPDIKWSDKNYEELHNIQYKILDNVSEYLTIGGKLVYSTCTINKRENEDVVERFITNHDDYKVVSEPLQLFPCEDYDGFFMCCFERVRDGENKA